MEPLEGNREQLEPDIPITMTLSKKGENIEMVIGEKE